MDISCLLWRSTSLWIIFFFLCSFGFGFSSSISAEVFGDFRRRPFFGFSEIFLLVLLMEAINGGWSATERCIGEREGSGNNSSTWSKGNGDCIQSKSIEFFFFLLISNGFKRGREEERRRMVRKFLEMAQCFGNLNTPLFIAPNWGSKWVKNSLKIMFFFNQINFVLFSSYIYERYFWQTNELINLIYNHEIPFAWYFVLLFFHFVRRLDLPSACDCCIKNNDVSFIVIGFVMFWLI